MGECGELGYYSNLSPGRGSLYLLTRETEPFCGKYQSTISDSHKMVDNCASPPLPANQFKINLMFTGSRLPLYTYGALQIKLINHDGINETFTLTRYHFSLTLCLLFFVDELPFLGCLSVADIPGSALCHQIWHLEQLAKG